MAKGTNQKLKLSYLAKILLEKTDDEHKMTMPQIISELSKYEISAERKSIYTDIAELQDSMGMDIIKEQNGRETFYYVGSRDFELAEVKLLVDAIQSSKFITERKSRELIKKMKSLVSMHQASQIQRQVFVSGRIKTMNESIYYNVDILHSAIAGNKKVRFKYTTINADKSIYVLNNGNPFSVSPWALAWEDENYYLVAFDDFSKTCKHYRVDKMLKLEVVDEPREGRDIFENFDMAQYSKATFGMYHGEKARVEIQIHNKMASVFFDRFGTDITFRPLDPKHSELAVEVNVSPQFFGWIFSLGKDVTVVGPKQVVDDMKAYAKAFVEKYDD